MTFNVKRFDLSCLFWPSFCCPQNKCPPLFIPFLGLTFRGFVLFCTVKQFLSPCLSLFIHPHTSSFSYFFSLCPLFFLSSFSIISSSKLWSLNDILRKMPTGLYLYSLLYFPWNKTTLTDAKQMNFCCACYSACIVHLSTPQLKQNKANIHFWISFMCTSIWDPITTGIHW